MEDVEYLALLRDAAGELRARVREEADLGDGDDESGTLASASASHEIRALLREADALVRVPEHVSRGILGGGSREIGEVIVDLGGHTDDMGVIMETRRRAADLIVRIRRALGSR